MRCNCQHSARRSRAKAADSLVVNWRASAAMTDAVPSLFHTLKKNAANPSLVCVAK
jgi:hypothetical protein